MSSMDIINKFWHQEHQALRETPFFKRCRERTLDVDMYKGFLRETYYNASQNVPMFALVSSRLGVSKKRLAKKIYKHCIAELGHEDMALADLRALGEDTSELPYQRGLPSTEALTAFVTYNIERRNPVSFFGYLFCLESLAPADGPDLVASCMKAGVPKTAMSFLLEHTEVDTAHLKLNEEYINGLIENDDDMDAVIYVLKGSCELYGRMMAAAIDNADKHANGSWLRAPWEKPQTR